MLLVEYVGSKPKETDCVAGTGITWNGAGDAQEVPEKAWLIMAKHPDVWRLVGTVPEAAAKLPDTIVVTDAAGRIATLVQTDEGYALPAGVVLADAPKAPGLSDAKQPKYALQGPEGVVVLDGMSDPDLAALADKLKLDIDLRKKGDGRRAAILDAVEAAAKA